MLLVYNHALSADGILLGGRTETLVTSSLAGSASANFTLHARFFLDNIEHRVLKRFFVLAETVLLPGVVEDAVIEIVPRHAAFKVFQALAVVGLLLEFESTAVLHILTELAGVAAT